jgi:2'-5' RNA ligase
LKFLGEIDEEGLSEVTRVLQDTLKDKDHFYIRLCSVGAFPKINYPRVIWVGIDKGDKETADIARELEENSEKIGIPAEDRKFSSHITIGRVKSSLNRIRLIQELNHLQNEMAQENSQCHKTLEFIVTKITLFKSTLTPKGPIYEALKEINLRVT